MMADMTETIKDLVLENEQLKRAYQQTSVLLAAAVANTAKKEIIIPAKVMENASGRLEVQAQKTQVKIRLVREEADG